MSYPISLVCYELFNFRIEEHYARQNDVRKHRSAFKFYDEWTYEKKKQKILFKIDRYRKLKQFL